MPFLTELRLDYVGRGFFTTCDEVVWEGFVRRKHYRIVVPAGFRTDLASIPRIAWPLLPANGWYEKAAVPHDRLCVELAEGICGVTSVEADEIFRQMTYEEVVRRRWLAWLVSWVLWTGVRWGALFNKARRPGWWRDGWLSVLITAVLGAALYYTAGALHQLWHTVA